MSLRTRGENHMSKMAEIERAIQQTQAARAPAPPLAMVETSPPVSTRPNMPPSRHGKIHVGAYLPEAYKRSILMLRATTGEDLQSLLARCLNEQFRLHGLPEVSQE
jgi:Antitoxin-like ribbon-helix-helix